MESSERIKRIRSRVVRARVIKWDEFCFGVAIDYADDRHLAYGVGTWNQALERSCANASTARVSKQRASVPPKRIKKPHHCRRGKGDIPLCSGACRG